ncbi:unnamed protein product [Rotaria sp. Silwood2]|nr:unnamed protein product [Rotaria sp. Silwood2]CAF3136205.1 unnamed protein product [Rotaria sp. Silwood2]CAF3332973.1 unnamed protein product [Rotaria sp. Silwood2]CAF3415277.1 unnamed protein product [Rotaria sp. Silwood2]CAF3959603.1 unnamed protein product [Rotaria sp. Silwood2]
MHKYDTHQHLGLYPSTSPMCIQHSHETYTSHLIQKVEMPTKFIFEFEIRTSSLVGHNNDYLLRALQHSLTDIPLTWHIQTQQE